MTKLKSEDVYKAIEASINNCKESQEVLKDDLTSARAYNLAIHHLTWVKNEIDNLVEEAQQRVKEMRKGIFE